MAEIAAYNADRHFTKSGVFQPLVTLLDANLSSADIQAAGLRVLHTAAAYSDRNRALIAAEGGIPRILAAFDAHALHYDVQLAGCMALHGLVCTYPGNTSSTDAAVLGDVAKAGALDMVKRAMDTFPRPSGPQTLTHIGQEVLGKLKSVLTSPAAAKRTGKGTGPAKSRRGELTAALQ